MKAITLLLSALLLGFLHPSQGAAALEQGLVAHLPLHEDLKDHAAKPNPVVIAGGVVLKDGAAWFPGNKAWLELPFIPLNERPFSVAVWVKPTGSEPTYGLLQQWDRNQTSHILHLMIRDGLRPWFGFYINDTVSPLSLSNGGQWQHLIFQYDGAYQQIWINGRLICRRAAPAYLGKAGKTLVGKNPNWSNVPAKDFEGYMSDFRLYDRVLAFSEITALAAAPPAATPSVALATAARAAQPPGSVAPSGTSAAPLMSIDAEKLQLRGQPGEHYMVEVSEDLVKWEEAGDLTVGANGLVEFVDDEAKKYRQRFYRIRALPVK